MSVVFLKKCSFRVAKTGEREHLMLNSNKDYVFNQLVEEIFLNLWYLLSCVVFSQSNLRLD